MKVGRTGLRDMGLNVMLKTMAQIVLKVGLISASSTFALAMTAVAEDSASDAPYSPPTKRSERVIEAFDHWENALDVKLTSLFTSSAIDVTSPDIILTAQWNYRFHSNTYVGATFSGVPESSKASTDDGSKKTFSIYYGGLNLAQTIWTQNKSRLVAYISVGGGVAFARSTPAGLDSSYSTVARPDFYYAEPGGYITIFEYDMLDLGVTASYRFVRLQETSNLIKNSDLNSAAYGLTVRAAIP